jgi:lipopolysaccharide heptosyltransferase II
MKNVLVIKTHAIGDVIMTTPAIRALRRAFPQAEISVLIGNWSSPVLKNNPYINHCIEFDDTIAHKKRIIEIIKLVLKIRVMKFDAVIIFHPSLFIHFFTVLAGIKNRFGLSRNHKKCLLTASVEEIGAYDYYYPMNFLKVIQLLTNSTHIDININDLMMDVFTNPHDKVSAGLLLQQYGIIDVSKLILIAPGGSANPKESISARVWPCEYFISLIQLISLEFTDYSILISGGKNDSDIAKKIHNNCTQVIDLSGKTNIYELIHIIGLSRIVICNDSAVLHMSIAQKRPTIGIFGPTSLKSRVPPSHQQNCVQSTEKCSPCYYFGQFTGCTNKTSCMRTILPEQVFQKVKNLLQGSQ